MDVSLERILSLIPRKPDGKFAHGALKQFANSIGLKSGNLVSDWINGRSQSYKNYLYEISAKYDVSVEWLKGETDIKQKKPTSTTEGEQDEFTSELLSIADELNDADRKLLLEMAKTLKKQKRKE